MKPVLRLAGVFKSYGRKMVLCNINLEIFRGEIVGLLGPNGSGKTTTLRIAAGLFTPDKGRVEVNGETSTALAINQKRFGYLPERSFIYEALTVHAQLDFVARARGLGGARHRWAIDAVLESCRLTKVAGIRNSRLSKGFRQRLGLAQALLGDPILLVLDEATAGLDPVQILETRSVIADSAAERGTLISTHVLEEAANLCDRVAIMKSGQIVATHCSRDFHDSGSLRIELTVAGISHDRGRALFGRVAGISEVRVLSAANMDETLFCCLAELGADPRADLTRVASQQGALLGIRIVTPSLEDLFFESLRNKLPE